MKPSIRTLALAVALLSLPLLGYAAYLLLGGMVGREALKAAYATLTVEAVYTILDDDNGGDCIAVGKWEPSSRTCTMTRDLPTGHNIFIKGDGITLDGDGHTITGNRGGIGVRLISNNRVTVRDLTIVDFMNGVFLQHARGNLLRALTIVGSADMGIRLRGHSNYNTIADNVIRSSEQHGIAIWSSDGNMIIKNTISETDDGIRLQSSNGNTITQNTLLNNRIEGIDLHSSWGNHVYFNAFLETEAIPIISDMPKRANFFGLSTGGNYYATFDEPSEGCVDENRDRFCDDMYEFQGGRDSLPFLEMEAWKTDVIKR